MDETAAPEATTDTPADAEAPAADAAMEADEATAAPAAPDAQDGAGQTETEEALGPDPLAKLDDDNSAFVLGIVPLVVIALFALVASGLYLHRRRKNWNELDDVLKIDGGDTPIGHSHFTTKDMQEMEPTRPSKQLTD